MTVLRPQQVEAKAAARSAMARARTVILSAPTGFGKGVLLADIAYSAVHEKHKSVLCVTNRRVVVKQLAEHCERAGIRVGIIMGDEEPDHSAPMQIASIQTLQRRDFGQLHVPEFILVDECHQMHEAYRTLLMERYAKIPALGFTATPVGPGGVRIAHFQAVVEPVRNSQVIEAGDLLRVEPYMAPSEPDLGGVELKRMSQDELGRRVQECTVFGDVFELWEPYNHMQTMVVLPSRAVCNQFRKICLSKGLSVKMVDGTTEQSERDLTFSEFKAEDCQMLLGVDVVREGLDLPIAQCLIDLQPTHQFRVYWQKLGRVKRPHEGQDSAVVIDLAGNLWRHMVHPDQDPPWDEITKDTTIEAAIEQKVGVRCPKCGSKDIYGPKDGRYHCEACSETWATKKPWVCPACRQALSPWQKCVGGKCPNCGAQVSSKPIRRIRFKDGSIRDVPADEVKRRKKKNADSEGYVWKQVVFSAIGANAKIRKGIARRNGYYTFRNCRGWFRQRTGADPSKAMWPWPNDEDDWGRPPEAVYPKLRK